MIQKKMIAHYSVSTLVGLKKMGIFDHILKVEKQTLPDTLMERHVFNIDEKQCLIIIFKVKVSQSCPTLSDPMDCNLPGSSVHGILQARILEWVAFRFSGNLPKPGIEPRSPALQVDSLLAELSGEPYLSIYLSISD